MTQKLLKHCSNRMENGSRFLFSLFLFSLFSFSSLPSFGCAWSDSHNYYLFSVCSSRSYAERIDKATTDNWQIYLGTNEEYFWFNADEVAAAAQAKGDELMVSYVRNLEKYLLHAYEVSNEDWNYPTKEELAEREKQLKDIRSYAQSKLRTRLRSQHALLFMRCNMMLGRHSENITFWQQTASQYIETVYKEMMLNIYAGALLRTGKPLEAAAIYAEQGDWNSLMAIYYQKRSYVEIRKEYERDANSPVLPFVVQDFVNNSQEAIDALSDDYMPGKFFIRDISESEARQMMQLAAQAVAEGRTKDPAMWLAAKAWLEYLFGDRQQARIDAQKALTLDGTPRSHDNARVINLFITCATNPPAATESSNESLDNWIANELTLLDQMTQTDEHYALVKKRLIHQALVPKYIAEGHHEAALMLYKSIHAYDHDALLDTMSIASTMRYFQYIKATPLTALDKYLHTATQDSTLLSIWLTAYDEDNQAHNPENEIYRMADLIGTKHLRLCQWAEAIEWLKQVPAEFYRTRGYAPYAARRSFTVEPWIKRQWLKEDEVYGDNKPLPTTNPKLAFAREMQQMESGLNVLKTRERQQRCYDLAVRYAQASYTGDCWFLMRDAKSVEDTVRVNEANLAARAVELLRQASQTKDTELRERALFALAYEPLNPDCWYDLEWNSELCEDVRKPQPATAHYAAWTALYNFERQRKSPPAPYVSRCDEYRQFLKRQN